MYVDMIIKPCMKQVLMIEHEMLMEGEDRGRRGWTAPYSHQPCSGLLDVLLLAAAGADRPDCGRAD